MLVTFTYENKKFENFDILDERNIKELEKLGIDILQIAKEHTVKQINTWVAKQIRESVGGLEEKLSAANSKAIVLLTKLLATLNPDTSNLTDLEKSAWDKLNTFANNEYADSELLNNSLNAVQSYVVKGGELIDKALKATTINELIKVLNELEV